MLGENGLRIACYQPHSEMPSHRHEQPSIGIVIDGLFTECIDRRERLYSSGTVSYCPPATAHSQRFGDKRVRQIIFTPDERWLDYLRDTQMPLEESPHVKSRTLSLLGERLFREMQQGDALSGLAREGLMLEIVAAFGRERDAGPEMARPPVWLRTARDFMHENANAALNLAAIARQAGRHEIHLAREFRRFFGISVGAYMRRLRIERAEQMLLTVDDSIAEIAQNCGFASHSHLCREFKMHFGVSPSVYRALKTPKKKGPVGP